MWAALITFSAAWPGAIDDSGCRHHLSESEYQALQQTVESSPVVIYALEKPMRCTDAAVRRLDALGVCYEDVRFHDAEYRFGADASISAPLWR